MAANRNKTPEGILLSGTLYQGGTVTNDAHVLKAKGIHSPKRTDMYAIAWHRPSKSEVWFRTEEKFNAWRKMATDLEDYCILMVPHKKRRGRPKNEK